MRLQILYFLAECCVWLIYLTIILLFLRQILPLFGKKEGPAEAAICRITEPLYWVGECFCRMFGIAVDGGGMDFRYPMAIGLLAFAVLAATGMGMDVRFR